MSPSTDLQYQTCPECGHDWLDTRIVEGAVEIYCEFPGCGWKAPNEPPGGVRITHWKDEGPALQPHPNALAPKPPRPRKSR